MNHLPADSIGTWVGIFVVIVCLVTTLVSFGWGVMLVFSKRPNRWLEALALVIGVPLVMLFIVVCALGGPFGG